MKPVINKLPHVHADADTEIDLVMLPMGYQ